MKAFDRLNADSSVLAKGRILIVSGSDIDLNILSRLLEDDGFEIKTANTGVEAIYYYQSHKPDLILMDVMLEEMDGYDAASKITELAGEHFIPIIFMSMVESADVMLKAVRNGGVDLLIKPYNQMALRSKVETFMSLSNLYRDNEVQRGELEYHNKELTSNYEVARNVFDKVIHSDVLSLSAIKFSISPVAIFNGDIILAAFRPSGELQVMVGDFTGHGISAAIGAIPVSEIFYGMTAKGFGILEILVEINTKIQRILPRGLFLAACTFEYNPESKKLSIWNAGMPDVLIFNSEQRKVVHHFPSKNFPLGVSERITVTETMDHYDVHADERILLFTDGIIEARGADNDLYGIDRVVEGLEGCQSHWVLDKLLMNLDTFTGKTIQSDDTTVFELKFHKIDKPVDTHKQNALPTPVVNSDWKMEFTYGATMLRSTDPLPGLIQMVMEMQKLQKHKQDLFILIKELYVNALDHGVLKLSSSLKQTPDGFSAYMLERQQRMSELNKGEITISLWHTGHAKGGQLVIRIKDSGEGFSSTKLKNENLPDDSLNHGRGLFMVRTISESLKFNETGNEVTACYTWEI